MLHDACRSLGAENALVHRMVTVALDIADLAIAHMHIDAATAGAHVACGLPDLVTDGGGGIDIRFDAHSLSSWPAIAAKARDARRAAGGSDRLVSMIGTVPPMTTPAASPPAQ